MKSKLIAFIVSVVMMVSVPIAGWCKAPSMAELLPADSLGYAELPNMEVFYYLISELGQAAIESLEEEEAVPGDIKVKANAVLEAFDEIRPLLPKSASLGIVSIEPGLAPSLVFVSELSEAIGPLAAAAGKLLAAAPNVKTRKTDYGTEVLVPDAATPPIGYAVRDNVLYVTMGEGLLDRVLSGATSDRLSQTAHFKEVNIVTGESALVSAYINLDAIQKFVPFLPPQAQQVVELLGLKDIHAAGISLSADEELVGFNMALQYTEDAPGIPSILSVPNTKPKGIAYVPDDFSYVTRFSMGPPAELMKKIRAMAERAGAGANMDEAFAQLKENAGIDLNKVLASLGGEITIGVKVPETLEVPNIVACVEAKDPQYLMETLKNLLWGIGLAPSEMEVGGKKVMMITTPGLPVSLAIAVDGDMIVMAISGEVLQKALAAKESGQNIATKPSFKAAMEGLPAAKNIALQYIELEALGKLAVAGLGTAAAMAPEEARPVLAKGKQYLDKAFQDLEPGAEVAYRTPNGLAIQSRFGTRSVMQILKNGAAFAVKAAMMFKPRIEIGKGPPEGPAMEAVAEPGAVVPEPE